MKKNCRFFMKGVNWVLTGFVGVILFACSNDDDPYNPYCSGYEGYYGSGLYEGGYGSGCASTNGNLKYEDISDDVYMESDSTNLSLLSPQQTDR